MVISRALEWLCCNDEAKMNMRLLMASSDPVAIDTIQSCIVGMDPEKVEYIKYLAEDGFGIIDTKQIDVVGNTRVDQGKKRFPLPPELSGGLLTIAAKDIKRRWYDDYEEPECSLIQLSVEGSSITAQLKLEEKATKLEMLLDGELIKISTESLNTVECKLEDSHLGGEHTLTLLVYDRFLSCTKLEQKISLE